MARNPHPPERYDSPDPARIYTVYRDVREGEPRLLPMRAIRLGPVVYQVLDTLRFDPQRRLFRFPRGSIVTASEHIHDGVRLLTMDDLIEVPDEPLELPGFPPELPGSPWHDKREVIEPTLQEDGTPFPTTTIHVYLQDEASPCFRPTEAEILGNGLYRLLPTVDYVDSMEDWQFPQGSVVECEIVPAHGNWPSLLAANRRITP